MFTKSKAPCITVSLAASVAISLTACSGESSQPVADAATSQQATSTTADPATNSGPPVQAASTGDDVSCAPFADGAIATSLGMELAPLDLGAAAPVLKETVGETKELAVLATDEFIDLSTKAGDETITAEEKARLAAITAENHGTVLQSCARQSAETATDTTEGIQHRSYVSTSIYTLPRTVELGAAQAEAAMRKRLSAGSIDATSLMSRFTWVDADVSGPAVVTLKPRTRGLPPDTLGTIAFTEGNVYFTVTLARKEPITPDVMVKLATTVASSVHRMPA